MREEDVTAEDGTVTKVKRCAYTPHSLRATTATLLLDAGVDIIKVKELLGHRHVTTTQIYDKRRRSLKDQGRFIQHELGKCKNRQNWLESAQRGR